MYRFIVPLFLISSVFAQTQQDTLLPKDDVALQEIVEDIPNNNFDKLISADVIVSELRRNYDIKGSVLLSKALWQILTSYNNHEQAKNNWQTAINEVTELDQNKILPATNFQFNAGQILTQHTHGMSMDKWTQTRVGIHVNEKNIASFLKLNDDLTIYLHLNDVWTIFLNGMIKQENIIWSDVFFNSLTIFEETENKTIEELKDEKAKKSLPIETINYLDSDFYNALEKWNTSDDKQSEFMALVKIIESSSQPDTRFYVSVLRFNLNKLQRHYLASSLSWFEVVYQINKRKPLLDEKNTAKTLSFIDENNVWFLSKETELLAIDEQLPILLESSIHDLKLNLQSDQANQEFDTDLTTIQIPNAYQLIEPLFNKHMATPFRKKIRTQLEVCLNISEEFAPFPQEGITRKQFKGCVLDLVKSATTMASERSLSGSFIKVDTPEALDRALQSPAWQTINILYAQVAQNNCLKDSHRMANPLEWALAAEAMLWFLDRWPGYKEYYSKEHQATLNTQNKNIFNIDDQINAIISQGKSLTRGFNCLDRSEGEILNTHMTQVVQAWDNVKAQIKQVAIEFNQQNLSTGSDIDLLASSEKKSNYRVEDAQVVACDVQKSCGVHVTLDSSRTLFGLFPQHLLLADQLKLGKLKLCYDNVGWENRRSAATHLANDSVKNYFGNFSFSIKGFYNEELVFERKLVDKEEYHYLFAENNEEVLSTYCPLSIVGNKISTKLERGTFGLVPNRLTFLTASRASESKILAGNWLVGSEWKDKISSQDVEIISENKLLDYESIAQKAYQGKATQLQELIYQTILVKQQNQSEKQQLLNEGFANLKRVSKLFSHILYNMRTDEYLSNDQLHGIMFGINKIPDTSTIVEYHQNQLNIHQLVLAIDENIKINQNKWNDFEITRSNAYLNNLLFRLMSVNQ